MRIGLPIVCGRIKLLKEVAVVVLGVFIMQMDLILQLILLKESRVYIVTAAARLLLNKYACTRFMASISEFEYSVAYIPGQYKTLNLCPSGSVKTHT